ncbi:hypothetical protein AB0F81_46485 [Actinoplanes sp. NPDC024001]|uniref:hypothetical protein n=1 Tax=Actinoplanes sp. NPDC024001 TaxID=3154598 RepID=UPI0033DD7E12
MAAAGTGVCGWMPVGGYAVLMFAGAPRGEEYGQAWYAWFLQPGPSIVAWAVAAGLMVVGAVTYARRGPAG